MAEMAVDSPCKEKSYLDCGYEQGLVGKIVEQ